MPKPNFTQLVAEQSSKLDQLINLMTQYMGHQVNIPVNAPAPAPAEESNPFPFSDPPLTASELRTKADEFLGIKPKKMAKIQPIKRQAIGDRAPKGMNGIKVRQAHPPIIPADQLSGKCSSKQAWILFTRKLVSGDKPVKWAEFKPWALSNISKARASLAISASFNN